SGAVGVRRPAAAGGGAAGRRVQRRPRRQGRGGPATGARRRAGRVGRVLSARLLSLPAAQAVSFVGSTPVARHVYTTGTQHDKRVQALGGAKNHMIVLPDAD